MSFIISISISMGIIEFFQNWWEIVIMGRKSRISQNGSEAALIYPFNPYIHGTSAAIFARLARTDMQLVSPVDMLEIYGMAPPSGEIVRGGLDSVGNRCLPCFGKVRSDGCYDYEHILKQYTKPEQGDFNPDSIQEQCRKELKIAHATAFSRINILMIYLVRAKQQGIDVLTLEEANTLLRDLNAAIQVFYLLLFLGDRVHPDFNKIEQLTESEKSDLTDAVYTHLTFENLLQKVIDSKIDIKSIFETSAPKGLQKINELLGLPKTSIIKSGFVCVDKKVTLAFTHPFMVSKVGPKHYENVYSGFEPEYTMYRLTQNVSGYSINTIFEKFIQKKIDPGFFVNIKPLLIDHVRALERRIRVFQKIIQENKNPIKYSPLERAFMDNPFPVILVCEDPEKLELINHGSQEYRAKSPLKVGRDITMIATDTQEHRLRIKNFLRENGIKNVEIVYFPQLLNGTKPQEASLAITSYSVKRTKISVGVVTGVSGAGFSFIAGRSTVMMGALFVALTSLISLGYLSLRERYLKSCVEKYGKDTIKTLQDPQEKQALQDGLIAESWKGYFHSFARFATYRYPRAFAAGMTHATLGNREVTDKIQKYCRLSS